MGCVTGNPAVVEDALDAGIDSNYVNADGLSMLFLASERGHTSVVRLLLERGADPFIGNSVVHETCLHGACAGGARVFGGPAGGGGDSSAADDEGGREVSWLGLVWLCLARLCLSWLGFGVEWNAHRQVQHSDHSPKIIRRQPTHRPLPRATRRPRKTSSRHSRSRTRRHRCGSCKR